MLSPRAAVRTLPSYHPPLEGRQGVRLDFNENTVGCSPRVFGVLSPDRCGTTGEISRTRTGGEQSCRVSGSRDGRSAADQRR